MKKKVPRKIFPKRVLKINPLPGTNSPIKPLRERERKRERKRERERDLSKLSPIYFSPSPFFALSGIVKEAKSMMNPYARSFVSDILLLIFIESFNMQIIGFRF